eukprot:10127616-Alexandrium_andersonii.AAC.1
MGVVELAQPFRVNNVGGVAGMRPFGLFVEGFRVNIRLHISRILVFNLDGSTVRVGEPLTQPLNGDAMRPMEVPHRGVPDNGPLG